MLSRWAGCYPHLFNLYPLFRYCSFADGLWPIDPEFSYLVPQSTRWALYRLLFFFFLFSMDPLSVPIAFRHGLSLRHAVVSSPSLSQTITRPTRILTFGARPNHSLWVSLVFNWGYIISLVWWKMDRRPITCTLPGLEMTQRKSWFADCSLLALKRNSDCSVLNDASRLKTRLPNVLNETYQLKTNHRTR